MALRPEFDNKTGVIGLGSRPAWSDLFLVERGSVLCIGRNEDSVLFILKAHFFAVVVVE